MTNDLLIGIQHLYGKVVGVKCVLDNLSGLTSQQKDELIETILMEFDEFIGIYVSPIINKKDNEEMESKID